MSKRVQRYECEDCGAVWPDAAQADSCALSDVKGRARLVMDKLAGEIGDELWILTLSQLQEIMALVKRFQEENRARPRKSE